MWYTENSQYTLDNERELPAGMMDLRWATSDSSPIAYLGTVVDVEYNEYAVVKARDIITGARVITGVPAKYFRRGRLRTTGCRAAVVTLLMTQIGKPYSSLLMCELKDVAVVGNCVVFILGSGSCTDMNGAVHSARALLKSVHTVATYPEDYNEATDVMGATLYVDHGKGFKAYRKQRTLPGDTHIPEYMAQLLRTPYCTYTLG